MCWQKHDGSSLMENVDLIVNMRHENHMMHVLLLHSIPARCFGCRCMSSRCHPP